MIASRLGAMFLIAFLLMHSVASSQLNNAAAVAAASGISKKVSTQEWLGPLSAVALSPFFGLACLSGAATFGPEWLQSRSSLLGESSPLNNPVLFWVMLGLTMMTSLPRFTKVSKPFALAVEKLEMYSAVIILISMKFIGGSVLPSDQSLPPQETILMTAGIATLPVDLLLSVAAALNIVIINTVKFAIELLVWLIPFPAVDAVLELGNKSLSATLMALYAYSPLLATALNLCILVGCCFVFFRVKRRLAYMKELIMRPLLYRLMGWSGDNTLFAGFLARPWNRFPKSSAFHVLHVGPYDEVQVIHRGWTKQSTFNGTMDLASYSPGLVCDRLTIRIDAVDVHFDVRKGLMQPATATAIAL